MLGARMRQIALWHERTLEIGLARRAARPGGEHGDRDTNRISEEAYERLALAEPDRKWELRDGVLREKPGMTAAHN